MYCCRRLIAIERNFLKQALSVRRYTNRNILKLSERGLINDIFPEPGPDFFDVLNSKAQHFYAGFDPTAESLHVGNLLVLVALIHCQRAGHNSIALIGGATARIGDPSGKNSERSSISADDVERNSKRIEQTIRRIFQNHQNCFWGQDDSSPLVPVKILNNASWFSTLSAVDFVAGTGSQFRLGPLLSRKIVENRLATAAGMSLNEFLYQVFQSHDWLHLYQKHGCRFQIGGSDQMGNIQSGRDLISKLTDETVYGITLPLIASETGDKYGKTAGNAVWLDPEKTSEFDLYQFFIRTEDDKIEMLLKLFTFTPLKEIEALMNAHKAAPEKRLAQRHLAEKLTLLIHGERGLELAVKTTRALYESSLESLAALSRDEMGHIFKSAETSEVLLSPGTTAMQLAMKANCFKFDNDAVRIISGGGFSINHSKVTNPEEVIVPGIHILPNRLSLLRVGKKNYYLVKWTM